MRPSQKILRLAANDLRLTLKDRAALIWMLALPLAFMWLFGQMGGGGNEDWRITLGVEDRDGGWLAEALVAELDDERLSLAHLLPSETASAGGDSTADEKTERKVRTLVIPEGFTEGVLVGDPQTLRLETEPGASAEFSVGAQMHLVRAVTRTLGRLVELGPGNSATGEPVGPEAFQALAARPDLVALKVSTVGRGRPRPSGTAQSVPGTLTMIVLMMTVIYGGVFLAKEKETGMLRRQASLPVTRGEIFLGKLVGRLMVAGAQILVLLLAGRFLFGVSWGNSPLGLFLVLGTYAFAVAGLSTLVGALVSTPDQASSLGWLLSMILAALGGCWWPSEIMPGWLRTAAHAFPTAWAMDGFHALISFGRGVDGVLLPALALVAFGVVFSLLGMRFLRYD
ncbi:MAG: ABC transporter permease [Deltaproteobacteria bacterium]|nr:ABC transporter permease [Deltaproteobacteria bacterium]